MALLFAADPPAPPKQPVPYSHKQHLALGLQCKNCHTNPDPGETMGIPATSICMECHKSVRADSAAIRKLAKFHQDKAEVPWVRVYRIPGYVFFIGKNRGGQLEDVMIYKLASGTNEVATIHAARGKLEVNPTNQTYVMHLYDANGIRFNGDRARARGRSKTSGDDALRPRWREAQPRAGETRS